MTGHCEAEAAVLGAREYGLSNRRMNRVTVPPILDFDDAKHRTPAGFRGVSGGGDSCGLLYLLRRHAGGLHMPHWR